MKRLIIFLSIACSLFFLDLFSKQWIHHHLPLIYSHPYYPYGGIGVFKDFWGIDFSIVHATNLGAAWGLFANLSYLLLAVRIALVGALFVYLFRKATPEKKLPLILIITGAFCNILDYFIYGHVVDLFYFVLFGYSYPIFNVADSAIVTGVALLFMIHWLNRRKKISSHAHHASTLSQ